MEGVYPACLGSAPGCALDALAATELFRQLGGGTADPVGYLGYLRFLAALHAALERVMARHVRDPGVQRVFEQFSRPCSTILGDLDHFRGTFVADVLEVMDSAASLAQQVMVHAATEPVALVGVMCGLEALRQL